MFKIGRTVQQIFNTARNVPKSLLSSINSGLKYCSQSKGYVEDAGDEFTCLKVLPSQSGTASIQDKLKVFAPNIQNIVKVKSTQLLDSAETRKLIYARFADEIGARSKDVEENNSIDARSTEIKAIQKDSLTTKKPLEIVTAYNITEEFNDLREQGYDFEAAKKAVQNQNNSKTLSERMKALVVSGHISRYSGESGLKEEVEELMDKHVLVIKEFMQKVNERLGFVSVDNSVLLIDSENDEAVSDICEADLLGEY